MRLTLRKHVQNNFVNFSIAIPNFIITLTTVTVAATYFHWSGLFSSLAYVIAQFFSLQYSALFSQATSMTLTIGKKTYHFGAPTQPYILSEPPTSQ
jgi:hypothetical protein